MIGVRINGEESSVNTEGLPRVADIVELIKSMIDPDHMITQLLIDGRDFSDADWTASPNQFTTSIIEVETGTPVQFVNSRMTAAPDIVKTCLDEFREARKSFQLGEMQPGNKRLNNAVTTLQAFFEWYASLLELVPENDRKIYDIDQNVSDIANVCKQICQQQLYQSWWALGESLKNELEPKLDELETTCRKFRQLQAA